MEVVKKSQQERLQKEVNPSSRNYIAERRGAEYLSFLFSSVVYQRRLFCRVQFPLY